MTHGGRLLATLAFIAVLGALGWGCASQPAIAPVPAPGSSAFPAATVQRGAGLAAIGNCAVCHTAGDGVALAGGRGLETPFGTIYSTNITPEPTTGIGNWSPDAFRRAMHEGVARDGAHLYPAFPYDHFAKVDDADVDAIYAFLMTRDPVVAPARPNDLVPPLGFRPLVAGWNALFLNHDPLETDPRMSSEWNRGRYLVDGLGHCGACHTARNALGAEQRGHAFGGGVAEGWAGPPLDATNAGAARWDTEALFRYLRSGFDAGHGMAAGPMGPVAQSLAEAPEPELHAIALYVHWLMHPEQASASTRPARVPPFDPTRLAIARQRHPLGAQLFDGACASCHGPGAAMASIDRAPLAALTSVRSDDPRNFTMAVLHGLQSPVDGTPPAMPAFADVFSDAQIADLAAFVRTGHAELEPWPDLEHRVGDWRKDSSK